jgi:hypothetical protein
MSQAATLPCYMRTVICDLLGSIIDMTELPQPTISRNSVITRTMIAAQIEKRLSGQLSDTALAAWAFDRFYAEELGSEVYEAAAAATITNALDALMFGDDPGFRLDEKELRDLVAQLGTL